MIMFNVYGHIHKLKPLISLLVKKCYSSSTSDPTKIRNIGILAHIDAGKTTTTERMLYYSGFIKHMGEVHHGNTVTDYMEQERDRGITIKSAAVTFSWKKHQFNLIDTPGHIDFTMEVEQTLNVLDGAVVIIDGSAGVEAQTLTVWRQSCRYNVPQILFVNKMDRADADFQMSCKTIEEKLETIVLPVHLPVRDNNKFIGVIDVLTLEKLIWDSNRGSIQKSSLTPKDGQLFEKSTEIRNSIIDKVSSFDDQLADKIIESESIDNIATADVVKAIKKSVINQKAVPVLCGSAYKNIGVEPLMDSVIMFLPAPHEKVDNVQFSCLKDIFAARVFKIIHDKQRGPLVFLRIYSGQIQKGQKVFNMNQQLSESTGRLYIAYADDFEEIDSLGNGNIAVVTGLKHTITGDFVTNSATNAQKINDLMQKQSNNTKDIEILKLGAKIPEPVFFCSIEPPSLTYQAPLEQALNELQREDPSLRVTHEADTGQTVLAGMGELHLEIIKDRIHKEYKIDADLGPLQISYREAPLTEITDSLSIDTKIGSLKQAMTIALTLTPFETDDGKGLLRFDKSAEAASVLANIKLKHVNAIKQGINVAMMHGPKIGSPLINVYFMLHNFVVGKGITESVITATTTQCIRKMLQSAGSTILEPIMHLEVAVPEEYLSTVMSDLSRKRASIENVSIKGNNKMVQAEVPLAELMGYSTTLRTMTSGTANFSMEFIQYRNMSALEESKTISSIRGF